MKKSPYIKCTVIAITIITILILSFLILDSILSTNTQRWLDGNAWTSIIIGAVSSAATVVLGYISYWQNKQQREDYKKAEQKTQTQYQEEKQKGRDHIELKNIKTTYTANKEKITAMCARVLEKLSINV